MNTQLLQGFTLKSAASKLGIGRTTLCNQLRERGIFFQDGTLPKPQYVRAGYFVVETRGVHTVAGIDKQYTKTLITGSGLSWLQQLFNEHSNAA